MSSGCPLFVVRSWHAKFSQVEQARSTAHQVRVDAEKKFETARKETGDKLTAAVDKFDKSVEKGASQTKGWLGGWFGGSK
jgi:hypothetical protein